jgi:hypothetical protein
MSSNFPWSPIGATSCSLSAVSLRFAAEAIGALANRENLKQSEGVWILLRNGKKSLLVSSTHT